MKKILSLMLVLMMLFTATAALAQEMPEVVEIGQGSRNIMLMVFIGDEQILVNVYTDQEYLLDALLEYGLVDGKEESWGYNVTTVATVNPSELVPGAYWGIYTIEGEEVVRLETPIQSTPIGDSYVCIFVLEM